MTNAVHSAIGQINGAGDLDALFLKMATGEILTAFAKTTEFSDKHTVRTITSGKSAQFPATGRKNSAAYHNPGEQVLGSAFNQAERVIVLDKPLVNSHFFDDYEMAKAHFDIRGPVTKSMGEELAQTYDKNVAQVGLLAARSTATVTGGDGGSALTHANFLTDSDELADAHFDAAAVLDEKFVSESGRYSGLKPVQYYMLAKNTKVINKDWDGDGSFSKGKAHMIAGIDLVKTSNLPQSNVTTGPTPYQGDFSTTAGLIWNEGAMGTVKLMDMAVKSTELVDRLGWLLIARYAVGHGILRPECAIELKTA